MIALRILEPWLTQTLPGCAVNCFKGKVREDRCPKSLGKLAVTLLGTEYKHERGVTPVHLRNNGSWKMLTKENKKQDNIKATENMVPLLQ